MLHLMTITIVVKDYVRDVITQVIEVKIHLLLIITEIITLLNNLVIYYQKMNVIDG